MADQKTPWHLDRKVPIGIILAGLMVAAGVVASNRDTENRLTGHDKEIAVIAAQRLSERVTTLESQMIDVRASLQRIEAKLDRLVEAKADRR